MKIRYRADLALVEKGIAKSREIAKAMIMSGRVYLKEKKIIKPSQLIDDIDELTIKKAPHPYVSRGGLKLEKAINAFDLEIEGLIAIDIGASTGGFTDVLLRNGAKHVYAVDVGYGQLDWTLRNDSRVTVMERTNARNIVREDFYFIPNLAVIDVSFISLRLILPNAMDILNYKEAGNRQIVALIKPQFEAGREKVGKKGVIRDKNIHIEVISRLVKFIKNKKWFVAGLISSPIKGPKGNIEYLIKIDKKGYEIDDKTIVNTVEEAHVLLNK